MAIGDILVLVSEFEGYPLILQEALAAGVCPVVMEVKSGIGDLITSGVNGWIVPQGDVETMAEVIVRLDKDRKTLEKNCLSARKRAKAERGLDVFIPRFHEILEHALRRPRPVFKAVQMNVSEDIRRAAIALADKVSARPSGCVAVYGAGIFGHFLVGELAARKVDVERVVDSNPSMWGARVESLVCEKPEALLQSPQTRILVASRSYGAAIKERTTRLFAQAGCNPPEILLSQ